MSIQLNFSDPLRGSCQYTETLVPVTNVRAPLAGIPQAFQSARYSCGAATVAKIMRLFGTLVFEEEAAKDLSTGDGTNHLTMVRYLEERGFQVKELTHVSNEELDRILNAKQVAMFFSQGWDDQPPAGGYTKDFWGLGHVMIPIGQCAQGYLFSDTFSSCGITLIPFEMLDKVWHYQTYDPSYDASSGQEPPKRYQRPLYVITRNESQQALNLLEPPQNITYATLLG